MELTKNMNADNILRDRQAGGESLTKKRQIRSSNFELLRILAMLMIIVFHIVNHCVEPQITDADSISRMGNGLFNNPVIYKKFYILYTIIPFGKIGVAIFVLISGYFLVKKGSQVDIAKIAKKLILQLGFASLVLVFASAFLYRCVWHGEQYVGMRTMLHFNTNSWFVGYYFLLVLLGFLFLNKFLISLSGKNYFTFLIVFFALSQFSWTGTMAESLATGVRVLLAGIFLYALGGYIRLYNPFDKYRLWPFLLVIALTYVVIYVSCYNNTVQKIEDYLRNGSNGTFYQSFFWWGDYSIVVIILSVAIFEIFRRIKMPNSRVINFIASGTFMVYLLHDNSFTYSIFDMKDWATLLAENPYSFMLGLTLWTLATFVIGELVYVVYLGVGMLLRRGMNMAIKPHSPKE